MGAMFRDASARLVVCTAGLGSFTDWTLFAAMVVTVDAMLGGGPWAVAMVLVARLAPAVMFAPFAARRADRGDLARTLIRHEVLRVAGVAVVAAAAWFSSVAVAVAGVVLLEFGAAMQAAARESFISRRVPRTLFTPVNTATAVLSYGLLPIGSAIIAFVGPAFGFGLALGGYGLQVLGYVALRHRWSAAGRPAPVTAAPAATAVGDGIVDVRRARPSGLARTILAAALGLMPLVALFSLGPELASTWLGDRAATGRITALAITGGAAGFLAANLRPRLSLVTPLLVAAAGLALASSGLWLPGLLLTGAGAGAAFLGLQNRLQHEASKPSEFARAFAALKIASGAAVIAGPAGAAALGTPRLLLVAAAAPVLAAVVALPGNPVRLLRASAGRWLRLVAREALGLVLRAAVRVDVRDEQRRVGGPAVIVSNHPHLLDGAVAVQADRSLRPIARWQPSRLARVAIWIGDAVVTTAGTDRDPRPAYQQAADHLRAGGRIWLAPEGGAHAGTTLRAPKSGAARMAHAAGVPIQPLAIRWEDAYVGPSLRRWRPWARRRVVLTWGEPLRTTGAVEHDGARMMQSLARAAGLETVAVEAAA